MKLRTKGNSIRLRLLQGELARLNAGEALQERLTFPAGQGSLGYALRVGAPEGDIDAVFDGGVIMVRLSREAMTRWNGPATVGIYGEVATPEGPLSLAVEKDFACLDGSDADNVDTFAHPTGVC